VSLPLSLSCSLSLSLLPLYSLARHQSEESRGYKELLGALQRVDRVPAAICTEKEVWAELSVSSDTIAIFRKVLSITTTVQSPLT